MCTPCVAQVPRRPRATVPHLKHLDSAVTRKWFSGLAANGERTPSRLVRGEERTQCCLPLFRSRGYHCPQSPSLARSTPATAPSPVASADPLSPPSSGPQGNRFPKKRLRHVERLFLGPHQRTDIFRGQAAFSFEQFEPFALDPSPLYLTGH